MDTSEAEHCQGPCGSCHPIFVGVILQFTSLYAIPIASLQNGSLLKLSHDKTLFFPNLIQIQFEKLPFYVQIDTFLIKEMLQDRVPDVGSDFFVLFESM